MLDYSNPTEFVKWEGFSGGTQRVPGPQTPALHEQLMEKYYKLLKWAQPRGAITGIHQ
jgi:hypothetical protein